MALLAVFWSVEGRMVNSVGVGNIAVDSGCFTAVGVFVSGVVLLDMLVSVVLVVNVAVDGRMVLEMRSGPMLTAVISAAEAGLLLY